MIDVCSFEAKPLLTVEEALIRIRGSVPKTQRCDSIPLQNALGRVLSKAVISPINLPYDRNSAMDGYAFSSQDIDTDQPFTLKLAGISWAGKPFQATLTKGQCVRIFTGAVVPNGADSVVIQEQVESHGERVTFPANCASFQNIRMAGEDVVKGGLLCEQHKKLTAVDLGLLASAGISEVAVFSKINIAFFSTGDELVSLGQPLESGKIYDSNRYTLAGLLSDPCFNAIDLGVIPDDRNQIENALRQAAETYDVIISSGGASVGDADYINEILASCGEVNFWKIAIKPGKPLAYGKIGHCCFFGLPGNPLSVLVTFEQLVAPALRQMTGESAKQPLRFLATCTTPIKKAPGRMEFQGGILSQDENGAFLVASSGRQGSHILSSISRSNCYIILEKESHGVKSGETVLVEPFAISI